MAKFLIANYADLRANDKNGVTRLHWVCGKGHVDLGTGSQADDRAWYGS